MAKLVADQLTLERSGRIIRAGLSFAVGSGEALQVIGPNGAGKTTLLRTIAGFLQPFLGSVSLEGDGDAGQPIAEQCHYIGHLNGLKGALTAVENAHFWAEFMQAPPASPPAPDSRALVTVIERVGLAGLADVPAAYLSAGQKRRLALARLLVAPRALWLLDEPTTSLDQAGQELLAAMAREHLAMGRIIVAATHLPLGFAATHTLDLGGAPSA